MKDAQKGSKARAGRRSFLTKGLAAAGAATTAGAFLGHGLSAFADDERGPEEKSGRLTHGDAALLRFAAAAEVIESDFWLQYNELGGIQDSEAPGGSGNPAYTAALNNLDEDMNVYIHDNTDDEISHFTFLNAYLESKGADPVDLEPFRTLPGSTATGSSGMPRITNLMKLTLDTSWWTRYRTDAQNPDLDPTATFPQAVPGLSKGKFTAIPRTDADLSPDAHIQAIANTAAFHFATIEQGGNSLYPSMAQRATDVEVLRILISIGPTETMHFQTWQDKAGHAVSPPFNVTDPTNGLTFPDLSEAGELLTNNLIMPEPCPFLSQKLPKCSIIRPTETRGIAMGVLKFLTDMGLFIGQSKEFFEFMRDLAEDADEARRGFGQ
ncbi:MAG: ferritin-like domain-containing protein [Acidobacteriia bacterium]|nr:ferritin-like domain-containing protein [Terriglobia bacterium]